MHKLIYINFFTSLSCLKCLFFSSHLSTSALSVLASDTAAVFVWWCTELDKGMCSSEKWVWKGCYFAIVLDFFIVLLSSSFHFLMLGHKLLCQKNPDFDLSQTNKGECCSATSNDPVKLWYLIFCTFLSSMSLTSALICVSSSQIAVSLSHFSLLCPSHFISFHNSGTLIEYYVRVPPSCISLNISRFVFCFLLHSNENSSYHHLIKKVVL